jgi:hypothetical protein
VNTGPNASRIRKHRQPFGNAARATFAVKNGTSPNGNGFNDIGNQAPTTRSTRPPEPNRQDHQNKADTPSELTNSIVQRPEGVLQGMTGITVILCL